VVLETVKPQKKGRHGHNRLLFQKKAAT